MSGSNGKAGVREEKYDLTRKSLNLKNHLLESGERAMSLVNPSFFPSSFYQNWRLSPPPG